MCQLSFTFDAPPESKAPPLQAQRAPALTPEDMARQLEQHPDYRVLRRLVPVLDYGLPPVPAGTDARALVAPRVLILDTETTGLSHESDRIIELAMLLVSVDAATGRPFGPVETFEGFEDPGMPIPEVAKQVTGITDEMVRGQRLDDARVQALIERAQSVLNRWLLPDRPFVEARFPGFAHKPWACSFADIDWKAQGAESAKLGALAQDRGWFYDAHRAEMDCHALLAVLGQPLPQSQQSGLARLLAAARQDAFQLQATAAPFDAKDTLKARGYRWHAEQRVWYTRLADAAALQAECEWLRSVVYSGRAARVQLEKLHLLINSFKGINL